MSDTNQKSVPAQTPEQTPGTPSSAPVTNRRGRKRAFVILGIVAIIGAGAYGASVLLASPSEETDDAYVGGNVVSLTARNGGTVLALRADNTQHVTRGQPLIYLDPALQSVALATAQATLGRTVRAFRANRSAVDEASAEVVKASADVGRASHDLARRRAAVASGAVSGEELSHADDALVSARAALELAKSRRAQAASIVQGTDVQNNPAVLAAITDVRRAAIELSYDRIDAPVTGVVAQRTVQLGQRVAAGTPLMSIVPLDSLWVDANFRETQLKNIRVGQSVAITSDVYGGSVRYRGHVVGLAPGSGNAFALLPAQNATGNWIKIVQRVPVRIALDPAELSQHPLRVGLSVKAEVQTSDRTGPFVSESAPPVGDDLQSFNGGEETEASIQRIIAQNMRGEQ